MTQDEQYLDILSIFHYVVGGLIALFSCFPFIHIAVGVAILGGAFGGANSPPRAFGWFFILFPAMFILIGWALSVSIIMAGQRLKKRTSHTFCLVVAGVECILFPFGTALGIFTLVVLVKNSVKELFSNGLGEM